MGYQPWFMELAGKGGPVGELVQWTDVISAVYMLGHDVTVALDVKELP